MEDLCFLPNFSWFSADQARSNSPASGRSLAACCFLPSADWDGTAAADLSEMVRIWHKSSQLSVISLLTHSTAFCLSLTAFSRRPL